MDEPHSSRSNRGLLLYTTNLGNILIQPEGSPAENDPSVNLILMPRRVRGSSDVNASIDWALHSDCPIYCHQNDLPTYEKEALGAHRFLHTLKGYREVFFEKGVLEFYPARNPKPQSFMFGVLLDMVETMGWKTSPYYHVHIKPKNEASVLYLAAPTLEAADWAVFANQKPGFIVGSGEYSKRDWEVLAQKINREILYAPEIEFMETSQSKISLEQHAMESSAVTTEDSQWVNQNT